MNRRRLHAALHKLPTMPLPPLNRHVTYSPRPRMLHAPWQHSAWVAVPLGTICTFAFVVAWRRRIVPAWVAGLYTLGSAFWWTMATQQDHVPDDRHTLLTWAMRVFIAVATIHVLFPDSMAGKPSSCPKPPCGEGRRCGCHFWVAIRAKRTPGSHSISTLPSTPIAQQRESAWPATRISASL
ncbi:hypothetical protein GCM10022295_57420 [Streptomyces osmaniensis]|uniref:Uncharacterized protein n=1 Tax=Streptomyces osmaniensis TaxID=593134 RepID=A0ABP6XKV6_9ACTN